tara:strand:- start:196 stop:396 length:201 start_codon:yes stop_codon:yes gene_type:complete
MNKNDKLFKLEEVLQYVPVSRSTWLRGVKSGLYPKPVKVSVKLIFWRATDIEKLLNGLLKREQSNG